MIKIVRYYDVELQGYLCFHHALVMGLAGHPIESEVEDKYQDEYDMRDVSCKACKAVGK